MGLFEQVQHRVWVSQRASLDVNVTVIGGADGVILLDTDATPELGRALVHDLEALAAGPLLAVVNTHAHYDHSYGNAAFRQAHPTVPIIAHDRAATELAATPERLRTGSEGDLGELTDTLLGLTPTLPDTTFSSVHVVDLGGRRVELLHPGPAHTGGDLVAICQDPTPGAEADVIVVGDLMERVPAWGEDSFPLAWPGALDLIAGLVSERTVLVPGHGPVMGPADVADQHQVLAAVAQQISDLAFAGVPPEQAEARGTWPVPVEQLAHAVARGYAQLPRGSRRLPMA